MSTNCSRLMVLSVAAAFEIFVVGLSPLSAQTTNGQTRLRTLASPQQDSVRASGETKLQVASPEGSAEARKLYKAGMHYGNAGFFTQAAELFQRAVRLKPDYADAYRSLGHIYFDLKQWEKAVHSLEQAVALDPKDKEARDRLDQARLMLETSSKQPEAEQSARRQESLNATPSISTISAKKISANELSLTKVYRVGPGDVLDVRLSQTSSANSAVFTISTLGLLEYPNLAEPLPVAGLTVEEISAQLESALKRHVAIAAGSVSVGVRDYVSHTILVSGLVNDPGTKILRREAIPLSVVVADAQPLPEAAKATIVRNDSHEVFTFDLAQSAEMNLLIHPGDVITLQANSPQFLYVSGEVKAPGEKVFRRGLTLTQAIITAGGLTRKSREARLARDDGKGFLVVTRYKLKEIDSGKLQDPLIQPGDRITIED